MENINDLLDDFDVDNLDLYEGNMYYDLLPKMCKADALQILINNVEGDYTQLSPTLAELAELLEEA